jgi:hypothetical protein
MYARIFLQYLTYAYCEEENEWHWYKSGQPISCDRWICSLHLFGDVIHVNSKLMLADYDLVA